MSNGVNRRRFIQSTSLATASLALATRSVRSESANERVRVAVMGVNGRGTALARGFASQSNCEVVYVCDVDQRAIDKAAAAIAAVNTKRPAGIKDFRRALDDKNVDALAIAAPNHWHAPATILGCSAGKHVYVEKPCSNTAQEGEWAVAAARKNKRVVTMGNQRRSWPAIVEGIQKVRSGTIGNVLYARTWYNSRRGSIGKGKLASVPSWLDFQLWQGPAPEKPFVDNLVHYNWHWRWHWGNGELGNNGIHALDVARWGMGVDYPTRVVSGGGRYRYQDDQETPDTHNAIFEFGDRSISWEGLSWSPLGPENSMFGISFHGDKGSLVITGSGYKTLDLHNKVLDTKSGAGGDATHLANFLQCIRTAERPNSDIEGAHKSTVMCHLGNISQRVGRALKIDSKNGHILDDKPAQELWGRQYRQGWEPKV